MRKSCENGVSVRLIHKRIDHPHPAQDGSGSKDLGVEALPHMQRRHSRPAAEMLRKKRESRSNSAASACESVFPASCSRYSRTSWITLVPMDSARRLGRQPSAGFAQQRQTVRYCALNRNIAPERVTHHFRRQARLQSTAGDNIDLAAQHRLEVEPQPRQIEQWPARVEIYQEVDARVVTLIAAATIWAPYRERTSSNAMGFRQGPGMPDPYFFFPCAATASMAAFTFSGSPR